MLHFSVSDGAVFCFSWYSFLFLMAKFLLLMVHLSVFDGTLFCF